MTVGNSVPTRSVIGLAGCWRDRHLCPSTEVKDMMACGKGSWGRILRSLCYSPVVTGVCSFVIAEGTSCLQQNLTTQKMDQPHTAVDPSEHRRLRGSRPHFQP